ncbi:MAG: FGGY-family carbohydrate kinase [Acidimicrobiales bacterium]
MATVSSWPGPGALLRAEGGRAGPRRRAAWHDGVRAALAELGSDDLTIRAVNVAAMVPSLCAVDEAGVPVSTGALRRRPGAGGCRSATRPSRSWGASSPGWPPIPTQPVLAAQARQPGLGGAGAIDTVVAMTAVPLFDYTGWDGEETARRSGRHGPAASDRGRQRSHRHRRRGGRRPLGPGTIDAFAEQLVAGTDEVGDVLVILGATLIVWAVIGEWREVEGLWTVPHTAPGKVLIGGPSNAGGLFVDWVGRLLGDSVRTVSLDELSSVDAVPVWQPYLRGERVPLHDPARRASLHDLHIGLDAAAVGRAAHEASAFATRHMLDLAGLRPNRIVATGGGTRDAAWVQALADGTDLPVDVVRVPEGGALGAAFLARITAGLEAGSGEAGRWAATDRRVEPVADRAAVEDRYGRYRELAR